MLLRRRGLYKNSILPREYQQVEYIESTGTQYINTQVVSQSYGDLSAEGVINIPNNGLFSFGAMNTSISDNPATLVRKVPDGRVAYRYGIITISSPNFSEFGQNISIKYDKDKVIFGNITINNTNTSKSCPKLSCYLFAQNTASSTTDFANFKLFTFKILLNNNLVRNYIPCYRKSDGEVGLYDLVSETFFTNQGTGSFKMGSKIK